MNRVQRYLDVVPLPLLIVAVVVSGLVVAVVPGRIRMYFLLAAAVLWTEVARLPGLGMIQTVTKATNFAAFLALAGAAFVHPGPKRPLPKIAWLFPFIGVFAFLFVITTSQDRGLVLILRVQWLFLTIAALMVARTIVDEVTLKKVLLSVFIGASGAMLVTFADLVLHPSEAFGKGLGRFEPWQANSNQIGVLYSLSAPIAAYWVLNGKGWFSRLLALGMLGLAGGMALITASRSTLITLGFPMLPILWHVRKKPAIAALGAIVVAGGLYVVLNASDQAEFERLGSVETGRVEIAEAYLKIIATRPIVGLMGTNGLSALSDPSVGTHPHNAYLESLYVGGIVYFAPILLLVVTAIYSTAYVYFKRRLFGIDPVLITVLCFQLAIMYAHGFVNQAILYPTYTWAFLHVLIATLMLGWAKDMRAYLRSPREIEPVYDPFQAEAYASSEENAGGSSHPDWGASKPSPA